MTKGADHKQLARLDEWREKAEQLKKELRSAHDELQRTNSELVQLALELEDRVEERTHELRLSKEELAQHRDHLQKLVEARTAELSRVNTELKERLLDLQASEERFRSLVVTIPDVVYRIDEEGNFTFVNAAINRLGYEPHELIGKHFTDIIWPTDGETVSRKKVLAKMGGITTGEESAPKLFDERRTGSRRTCGLEVRLKTKTQGSKQGLVQPLGSDVFIVEVNSAGMYGQGDDADSRVFIGTVGVIRDITDRKQTEKKILRQSAAMEGINRVFRASLEGRSEANLARVCLTEALSLTGSPFGLICEINNQGQLSNIVTNDFLEKNLRQQSSLCREFRDLLTSLAAQGESRIILDYPEGSESTKVGEIPLPDPPLLVVPLKQAGRTIGLLGLAGKVGKYDPGDLNDVETLAAALVESLMRQRAEQELGRRVADLSALNAMATIANLSLNVDIIAQRALTEVRKLVDAPACGIMLLDEKTDLLVLAAGHNLSPEFLKKGGRVRLGQGVPGNVARSGEPTIIGDVSKFDGPIDLFTGVKKVKSVASIPLLGPDGVIGVLCLGGGKRDYFDPDLVALLKALGRQVAIGVAKARLYERQHDASTIIAAERSAKDTINAMGDGLILLDNQGLVTFVNPAFEILTGYSRDDLKGKKDTVLARMLISPKDLPRAAQARKSLKIGHIPAPLAIHCLTSSGDEIPVLTTMSVIKSIKGDPTSTVIAVKDITEIRKTQESLQKLLDELQRSQAQLVEAEKVAALGTMTAGVAHELNNPMMGLLNYVQYCLKHTEPGDRRHEVLKDAEHETLRCVDIVRNLLTFSRLEKEGEEGFIRESLPLVLDRVLRLLTYRIEKENITLIRNLDPNLPRVEMKIGNIQQVFLNLIVNALDAVRDRPRREITISARAEEAVIKVLISDTGPGIDTNMLSKIFDPFFTTKPPGRGTGLGLSVSRSIITAHGGSINCVRTTEEGASFEVQLLLDRHLNSPKTRSYP